LRRGVALALGTDGSSCNDNLVMHEVMRAIAVAHRPGEPDRSRWIAAGDALHMGTSGGARALRQKKLGAIVPGFIADLVVYRLDAPWWVPVNDVVNQLVFAETGASVDTVLIDGRIVVENRVVRTFDVEELLREVRSMTRSLRTRNADLFEVAHDIAELVP
jgi:cytosine/adenosine deaminase-related metal-dependent hydrolase